MSRFLFVVPPFFGHISPTLSIGSTLIARGHEVKWIGITPLADKHIPEGGEFIYPGSLFTLKQIYWNIRKRLPGF
ncbi:hypothetical protein [Pedobacter sp. NJ-S-72]